MLVCSEPERRDNGVARQAQTEGRQDVRSGDQPQVHQLQHRPCVLPA